MARRNGPKTPYPKRRRCTGPCGKRRVITKFRLLRSGYRQGMCQDCEREYDRRRWELRPDSAKAKSGGNAARRRAAKTAVAA